MADLGVAGVWFDSRPHLVELIVSNDMIYCDPCWNGKWTYYRYTIHIVGKNKYIIIRIEEWIENNWISFPKQSILIHTNDEDFWKRKRHVAAHSLILGNLIGELFIDIVWTVSNTTTKMFYHLYEIILGTIWKVNPRFVTKFMYMYEHDFKEYFPLKSFW